MILTAYTPTTLSGTGSLTTFGIGFEFLDTASYIKVSVKEANGTVTLKTSPADYSVVGSNVEFVTAPLATDTVIIELNVPYLQNELDLVEDERLPAESTEKAFDKLTLLAQQAENQAASSIKMDAKAIATMSSLTLAADDAALNRADKYVRMNAAGDGLILQTLTTSSGLGDIVDDVSPQLGADLDLNNSDITGTGNINITGNISVTGTVDGRDVATDGTKLDGIEASADVTDEANVKSALDGATISAATVAGSDKVLIQDADDSSNLKTVTAQSIADLGSADVATQADMEAATSTTKTVTPGRMIYSPNAAKAWASFNGTGTPAYRGDHNFTSSITDNGPGDYTLSLDVTFSSTDSMCAVMSSSSDNQSANNPLGAGLGGTSPYTTTSVRVELGNNLGTSLDKSYVSVVIFGDLA